MKENRTNETGNQICGEEEIAIQPADPPKGLVQALPVTMCTNAIKEIPCIFIYAAA